MNTAQSKLIAWSAAGVLGVGLSLYVGWFVSRLDRIQTTVTKEQMQRVLEDVGEIVTKADDIVPYSKVEAAVILIDWTGRPVAEAQALAVTPEPPKPSSIPVRELVKVMWIAYDGEDPSASNCVLKYTPAAQVRAQPPANGRLPGWQKQPGQALDAPLDHITVAAIHPEGVEFAFDGDGRENEMVLPGEMDLQGLARVADESDLVLRRESIAVPRISVGQAVAKTTLLREGIYQIGTEDAEFIGNNFAEILSSEVRSANHRDARTGRPDGVQLLEVKPDSIAAAHGVSTGDVVKSINGHPVTSTQEAISYVKNNKDLYDKWEVVIESKGRLKTIVYYSPKQ